MKKSINANFYPVLINLSKFPCLVVGGGNVALRKVLSLLEFGAKVTVISPVISKALKELHYQRKINLIKKVYSEKFIKDFKIIFSATDNPDTNNKIRYDCTKNGILLNAADNPPLCDFILPANVKRGNLTISISSQGKAPFYTKKIKELIDIYISPSYEQILNLAGIFRKEILSNRKNTLSKNNAFKKFTETDWESILKMSGNNSAKKYLKRILKEIN